jgi:cytochrome c556
MMSAPSFPRKGTSLDQCCPPRHHRAIARAIAIASNAPIPYGQAGRGRRRTGDPMIASFQYRSFWLGVALLALPAAAVADAVEYRQHVMKAVGGHMQSSASILRGLVPHQDHLPLHVDAIAELAQIVHTLFPEGSRGGDARAAIWNNPDDFDAKLAGLREAAGAMSDAVANGDGVMPAFQRLGQACRNCHDDYRD